MCIRDRIYSLRMGSDPLVRDISDTARWVAYYRAQETDRPDPHFRDPFARQLAGERGEKIAKAHTFGDKNAWSFTARTVLFDEFITCLLYTSDAADERSSVDLGGRRI